LQPDDGTIPARCLSQPRPGQTPLQIAVHGNARDDHRRIDVNRSIGDEYGDVSGLRLLQHRLPPGDDDGRNNDHTDPLLYARDVTEEARLNPVPWNGLAGDAMEPGLDSLEIARRPVAADLNGAAERRRVFSGSGRVLIDTATSVGPAWPMLIRRLPIMDGTTRLGEVQVARSLHPALVVTAAIACGSICLGLLTFLLLRGAVARAASSYRARLVPVSTRPAERSAESPAVA
jgi:hypothetical protein